MAIGAVKELNVIVSTSDFAPSATVTDVVPRRSESGCTRSRNLRLSLVELGLLE